MIGQEEGTNLRPACILYSKASSLGLPESEAFLLSSYKIFETPASVITIIASLTRIPKNRQLSIVGGLGLYKSS